MVIPEPVKRAVRQNSGFGCCKCGLPIVEYHHIVRNSEEPNDLMLLCPNHHHEATVGAMTKTEQKKYQKNPINIEKGYTEGLLKVNQSVPVVKVGNCVFIGDGDFLLVDDESLLSLKINEGRLELSLKCYDSNDNLVAKIKDNEWVSGNPLPWDLEAQYQHLKIRRKLRDIQLDMDAKRVPISIQADLWRKKQNFKLNKSGIFVNGVVKNTSVSNLGWVGTRFVIDTESDKFSIDLDPRFPTAQMLSGLTNERISDGIKFWEQTVCTHDYSKIREKKKYTVYRCRKCGHLSKKWKT